MVVRGRYRVLTVEVEPLDCDPHGHDPLFSMLSVNFNEFSDATCQLRSKGATPQFTCFTSTKVQMLTPEELLRPRGPLADVWRAP